MSGIYGLVFFNSAPDFAPVLDRIAGTLAHRGPDGHFRKTERMGGLGFCQFQTTPEAIFEKLPLRHPQQPWLLTADVRLDNREELGSKLGIAPAELREMADSDFVLPAYEKWGESMPEHLLGDFALAIWDEQKNELFCARDQLGIKPFYYAHQPGRLFAFASEIKTLLASGLIERKFNGQCLMDHCDSVFENRQATLWQGILKLPPAHSLKVSSPQAQTLKYWKFGTGKELRLSSDAAYDEAFHEIFYESVRCRLRSKGPVCCQLSGGLDSSAVTAVVRDQYLKLGMGPVTTFTNIFDSFPECDERQWVQPIVDQGGINPQWVAADENSPAALLDQRVKYEEHGLFAPNTYLIEGLYNASVKAGFRVTLDGVDGDRTIGHGANRFYDLALSGDWNTFSDEVLAGEQHGIIKDREAVINLFGGAVLKKYATTLQWGKLYKALGILQRKLGGSRRKMVVDTILKPFLHSDPKEAIQPSCLLKVMSQDFLSRYDLTGRTVTEPLVKQKNFQSDADFHAGFFLTGNFAMEMELFDIGTHYSGIEARHPFMDRRLIDFCLSLPAEQKLKNGFSRQVLRRFAAKYLPEKVAWRTLKTDMAPSFQRNMLYHDRQKIRADLAAMAESPQRALNDEWRKKFEDFCIGKIEAKELHSFWVGYTLERWQLANPLSPTS